MLRCPIDGTKLAIADDELVGRLNDAISRGDLRDRQDQKVTEPIEAALVTEDRKRAYVVRGAIPTLISDESIDL